MIKTLEQANHLQKTHSTLSFKQQVLLEKMSACGSDNSALSATLSALAALKTRSKSED
jgi:hypothetical protein